MSPAATTVNRWIYKVVMVRSSAKRMSMKGTCRKLLTHKKRVGASSLAVHHYGSPPQTISPHFNPNNMRWLWKKSYDRYHRAWRTAAHLPISLISTTHPRLHQRNVASESLKKLTTLGLISNSSSASKVKLKKSSQEASLNNSNSKRRKQGRDPRLERRKVCECNKLTRMRSTICCMSQR